MTMEVPFTTPEIINENEEDEEEQNKSFDSSIEENSETSEEQNESTNEAKEEHSGKEPTHTAVHRFNKPSVEDRALQDILAARRMSIETQTKGPRTARPSPKVAVKLDIQEELFLENKNDNEQEKTSEDKFDQKDKNSMKECEELLAARNPTKWINSLSSLSEMSSQPTVSWRRISAAAPMYEPVKEITYRMFSSLDDDDYIAKMKPLQQDNNHNNQQTRKTRTTKKRQMDITAKQRVNPKIRNSEENSIKIRLKNTQMSMHLNRELLNKKKSMLGIDGGLLMKEMYTDKDRAAAVTLGDQDLKKSLKVKQKSERFVVQPEDMDSNVYLTEAQKNLSVGNLKPALICANKAVEVGGPEPLNLLMRSRCFLKVGKLNEALEDAQNALKGDFTLIKALSVQAEALYTMGEFERALVLFHRGHRRRPDLASFQKGIHKAREAIINAIGGNKFPKVKQSTMRCSISGRQFSVAGSSPERKRNSKLSKGVTKKEGVLGTISPNKSKKGAIEPISPLVTEIKTSKLASKRLLGGLSSDKEFLSKLLTRSDLSDPLYSTSLETPRIGRRRSSVNIGGYIDTSGGTEIINTAKEALQSLQYLEAFLWQRDPDGLSICKQGRPIKANKLLKSKRITKINEKKFQQNKNKKDKETKKKPQEIDDKISHLLNQLKISSGEELEISLEDAESFVENLRKLLIKNGSLAPNLSHLLIGIGRALPKVNRAEDGIAVLRDAVQFSKQRSLQEEYRQAAESLGRVLATEGFKEEAVEVWASLIDVDKNSFGSSTTTYSNTKSSFSCDTTTEEASDSSKLEDDSLTSPTRSKNRKYSDFDQRVELNTNSEITSRC